MTLKYINADEIASSMMDVLGDKDFQAIHKKASFEKKAEGEEALLEEAVSELGFEEEDLDDIEVEEEVEVDLDGIDLEEGLVDFEVDMSEGEVDMGDPIDFGDEDELDDLEIEAALKVTKSNLAKMANALDTKGFAGIASIIDDTIVRLSAKKEKKCKCLDTFKAALAKAKKGDNLEALLTKHKDDLAQEDTLGEARKAMAARAKELGMAGYTIPKKK